MGNEKWTAGPWAVGGSLIAAGSKTIALMLRRPAVYGGKVQATRDTDRDACETGAEADANARLIAAAPEMAEALDVYHAMTEAIVGVMTDYGQGKQTPKRTLDRICDVLASVSVKKNVTAARAALAKARGDK